MIIEVITLGFKSLFIMLFIIASIIFWGLSSIIAEVILIVGSPFLFAYFRIVANMPISEAAFATALIAITHYGIQCGLRAEWSK